MNMDRIIQTLIHLRDLKGEQWLGPEEVASLQVRRLEGALRSAYETSHYRDVMDAGRLSRQEFERFPITTKKEIRRSPSSFINARNRRLSSAKTSGSTGAPLEIFFDSDALHFYGATKLFMLLEFGLAPATDLIAEINVWIDKPQLKWFGPFRHLHLPIFGREEDNYNQIRKHNANAIRSYPSEMEALANINNRSGRPLRFKFINCGGETLTKETKRYIEESFSTRIFLNYGCTEAGYVAWECPEERSLHVNASSVLLEIVDKKGKAKKNGVGDVLLTTLRNDAMPLIRYRIGDRGSWGKECPCGRGWPVLKSLEGRSGDGVRLPSGKIRPTFAFNVLYNLKADILGIRQFQIVQEKPDHFVFRYVPAGGGPDAALLKEIDARVMLAVLGEDITLEFQEVDSILRGPGGKLSHIIPYRG